MDKVFSARLDEAVLSELDQVVRRLGMTKREFLEQAIRDRVRKLTAEHESDVWSATSGAWTRRESAAATVRRARRAVEGALGRKRRAR